MISRIVTEANFKYIVSCYQQVIVNADNGWTIIS